VSDKQEAFLTGIAAEFPAVPHHFCENHFLRDATKPVLEQDRHAKVQVRSEVRGLRAIAREVLEERLPAAGPPEISDWLRPSNAIKPRRPPKQLYRSVKVMITFGQHHRVPFGETSPRAGCG
jgi:hypothetical protein